MNTKSNTATMGRFEAGRDRHVARAPILGAFALNAKVPQAALEGRGTAAIAIVNQKSWRPSIPSAAFDQLLGRPLRSWTWRHRHVQNFSVDAPDHKKTYSVWNQIVRTQKKSHAHIFDSCRFRNSRHPGDGPRLWRRLMYLATVLAETLNPNLASSA